MALPRFLYSQSESIHEKFIPESECEEPLLVSPKTNREFTGALSKSKKEIANNPALRPSLVGNLQDLSESREGDGDIDASSSAQHQQGGRREWEFGAAAVAMELSEPGAGEKSDSDESGILEHMGEEKRSSERKKKKKGNGVVVEGGGRAMNDGGNSESFPAPSGATSRSSVKRESATLSGIETLKQLFCKYAGIQLNIEVKFGKGVTLMIY